jgi:hypothetical protein
VIRQLVLAVLVGLATLAGVSAGAAKIDNPASARPAKDGYRYLCQKKDKYGCWCTCYVCYCYADAMKWYKNQDGNARIIAQME